MILLANGSSDLNMEKLSRVYCRDNELERNRFCDDVYDYFAMHIGGYAVWQEGEDYVCAVRLEPYRDGFLISCLQTGEGFRRQGYAESLIRAMQLKLGKKLYSHVAKSNRPSLQLHQKCGFCRISDTAVLLDGTVTSRYVTLCLTKDAEEKICDLEK